MSADAIEQVTDALRTRLAAAVGQGKVHVGPPVEKDVTGSALSLFLFHVVPSQAVRNERHLVARSTDPAEPLVETDALPLDLRFLLSVFRTTAAGGNVADPNELHTLGKAVRALHADPVIGDALVPDQLARVTPEPYPMEELSRVWGLFPQTTYCTSMVYLVSPVWVALDPPPAGRRVVERRSRHGQLERTRS